MFGFLSSSSSEFVPSVLSSIRFYGLTHVFSLHDIHEDVRSDVGKVG